MRFSLIFYFLFLGLQIRLNISFSMCLWQEPEREVHRLGCQLEQLRCQKSNLEISLCDMAKVAVLWSCKLAEIREAQNYVQAERSDAGSLAILEAEKHRLQVLLVEPPLAVLLFCYVQSMILHHPLQGARSAAQERTRDSQSSTTKGRSWPVGT